MKSYQLYKQSNISELGAIPEHWKTAKITRIVNSHKQGYYTKSDYGNNGIKLLRITDINDNSEIDTTNCPHLELSENEFKEFSVLPNDFVFARSGTVGRFGIVRTREKVVFASYLIRFRFRENIHTQFLKYFFLSHYFKESLKSDIHGGANQNIHAENIKNQYILIPTYPEQKIISNFLDNKTSQIDSLIEKKKRLIELLKEYRTAIINHAVTKGLDSNVRMKDSGIEWIGQIPEHWEVKKLKWLVKEKLEYGANESAELDDITLPRYIRITDFGEDGELRSDTFKSLPVELAEKYLLENGDILLARSGATVGKTFQFKNYSGKACFAGYLIRVKPDSNKITSDFLYIYTKSQIYENWKNSIFSQATIQNISADKYQYLVIPFPQIKEQKSITSFISNKSKEINRILQNQINQIELLQEYRTSLISNAVTGKIDVRDEVEQVSEQGVT